MLLGSLASVSCGDAAGIESIHFTLSPPVRSQVSAEMAVVVDPFAATFARGTLEVMVEMEHLMSSFEALPALEDPAYQYGLWLTPEQDAEEHHDEHVAWTLAGQVSPDESGDAELHVGQPDVDLPFETVRRAIVTLDPAGSAEPSETLMLSGATTTPASPAPGAGGGHTH